MSAVVDEKQTQIDKMQDIFNKEKKEFSDLKDKVLLQKCELKGERS